MKPLNILVVDDVATDRAIITKILTEAGHTVIPAESGQQGVDLAKAKKPDAIFMDVVMEGMDGFKATRTISKDPETATIPVIICSSKSRDTDQQWAVANGAKGYIVKPAKDAEVLGALAKVAA